MLHGWIGGAVVSLVAAFVVLGRSGPIDAHAAPPRAAPDGKALYLEHCAGCHGKDGGGDGPTAKDLRFKPRAFKEGRFAFGNTADVMAKTVGSGVPGEDKPRMPAFKGTLDDDEIKAVVEFVRTLMPKQQELGTDDMTMAVTDEAKLARGILAPLRPNEKPIARGLLVGTPGGLSFEYGTDDLRLLAVRRFDAKSGEFLTRSDWQGRGGRPLTPLGEAAWIAPTLAQWAPFLVADPPKAGEKPTFAPATSVLRATRVKGPVVELEVDLVDANGKTRAHVTARPGKSTLGLAGAGAPVKLVSTSWSEQFELTSSSGPVVVLCSLATSFDHTQAPDRATRQAMYEQSGCVVLAAPDGSTSIVHVAAPKGAPVTTFDGEHHECVDVQLVVDAKPVVLQREIVVGKLVPDAKPGSN